MDAGDAQEAIFSRNVPSMTAALSRATVGVAGCGGLGSNAALSLVRAGVGRLILVDHDRVELSNLNRQQFIQADVGRVKVEALADHLRAIRPEVDLELHLTRLEPERVAKIYGSADLLIEAFDRAEDKQWLIEAWCAAFPERPIICASGIGGAGNTGALRVRSAGQVFFCGDGRSDMALGLCAARVAIVANMQANVAIELLMAAAAAPEPPA